MATDGTWASPTSMVKVFSKRASLALTLSTRIAVMYGGYVQQLGTPKEVYDNPANMFVAGFMGSPSMNLFPAKVAVENGRAVAKITLADGGTGTLPFADGNAMAEHDGRDIILGIRPEAITDEDGADRNSNAIHRIDARVEITEPAGSDTFVVTQFGGKEVTGRFRADVELPTAHQRVARDQRQVEEDLGRQLAEHLFIDHPADLDPASPGKHALDRDLRLMRRHRITETARRTKGQAEEFQLVRRCPRAVPQQIQAALAHRRIGFVRHQFQPVVERADRAQQVVAQARTEKAGKFDAVGRVGHADADRQCL